MRLAGLLSIATLACHAASQGPSASDVNSLYPQVEALYIDLHSNPELAFEEKRTAAKLADRLKKLGYEVTTGVGGTGVVGLLKNRPVCRSPAKHPA
jgi:hippurate hydrolase